MISEATCLDLSGVYFRLNSSKETKGSDMTRIEEIRRFMEKPGLPGRDLYGLPDSEKKFPDGAHYGIEIAGIESPQALETLLVEAKKREVPVS